MQGLRQSAALVGALVGLAACASLGGSYTNLLDGNDYRALLQWPLLCHPDGSIILAQKANSTGGFAEAKETSEPCTPISGLKYVPDQGQGTGVDVPASSSSGGSNGDAGTSGNSGGGASASAGGNSGGGSVNATSSGGGGNGNGGGNGGGSSNGNGGGNGNGSSNGKGNGNGNGNGQRH